MANIICQSRDCDVYCLELDELDGLQIVVKGHKYDNVNKDLNDHSGSISNTETCMIQSAQNFKYFPSISQAEKSKGGVENITKQTTPSNTKQTERRRNQLQRCLFTNNRPATHLQPEIHCAHLKIHEWCQNVKSSTNGDNILTLPSTSITTSATQQMCSIVPKTTLPSTGVIANTIQRSSSIANTTVGSSLTPKNLFDQEITQCLPLLDSEIMPTTLENFVDHKTTKCLPLLDSKVMPTTPENFVNHETTHYVPPVDLKNMSDSLSNSGGLNNPRASSNVNTQSSVSSNVNQKHHSTRHSFGSNIYSSSTHLSAKPRRPNIKPRPTCVGCNMTQPTSGINCNTTVSSNSGRRDVHSKCQADTDSSECNKGKKLSSLRNYLDRPYNCSTCLSRFIRKYDLDRHTRMHSGNKAYQCQDCGKKFPENYRLQSHRKRHKSSYQSECPVCGKLFLKHLTLKTHMKIHKWRESI
ncbi:zinc finger protein Gfi-1b-like [Mytilus trossulus]|uniref:zinc finger protein Gfi-1b-like n=1 Tax=Mytilus trossulus TaxID=6551 RepID=UPI003003B93F